MFAWQTPLSTTWKDSLTSSARTHAIGVDSLVLTGATGFIGGSVLATLVNAGLLDRVICLVRGTSAAHALARLRMSAVRSGLPRYRAERLTQANVIVGELGGEFSAADEARLAGASHVINCAAPASLSTHARQLDMNVRDTLRFASRFACSKTLQRFVHVSAAMACGTRCSAVVPESLFGYGESRHLVPHTQIQREAERLLRLTYPRLPMVVVRPSTVVGHTVLGTSPSARSFWVFRVVHAARRFAARAVSRIDVVSVDDCARALTLLTVKPRLAYDTYHVSAGANAATITQIVNAMDEATGTSGKRYSMCAPRELRAIARETTGGERAPHSHLVERALGLYAGFAQLDYVFDNRHLREEIGFDPLPFTDYLNECVRTSQGIGIVEQMKRDFVRPVTGFPAQESFLKETCLQENTYRLL
ncbi:SDR family oxidoreductase [Paraburkholderia megapolitana]|uniref:Thioester reductase domain-containing protein n=1 Tax=Paraburkholderia megapolitana TaxID=420953 RepID=A0A1I3SPI3_9BURK|nr:SDR family oxidoreductase [Paraburkholderia megapolitana]QDQ85648.1 NAD-dependent epimerase/dehydratase family protein [Paraburkholderia megapolitana]SFJ59531.1 Thioester reductase domain-containing protein [Paraburkholderia megapolitana]